MVLIPKGKFGIENSPFSSVFIDIPLFSCLIIKLETGKPSVDSILPFTIPVF